MVANGLFYGKAVLTIDGRQVFISVGETKRGVKLVEADEDHAIVLVDGKKRFIYLDTSIAKEYSTPQEFERHSNAKSHVIEARLIHQTENLATFQVEYYYNERELGNLVTLSAKTYVDEKETEYWAYSYTRLTPGRDSTTITLSMNEKAPEKYLSDKVRFDLVFTNNGQTYTSGTLLFDFTKEWQR